MKHKKKSQVGMRALRNVQKHFPGVTSVVDATSDLVATVTSKDDKNSRLKNHAGCALAVACQRKEHADGAIVSVGSAYVIKGNVATRYRVPQSSAREVISFDRHGGFEPGEYKLKAPTTTERLGATTGNGPRPRVSKKNTFRHVTTNIRTNLNK